MRSAGIGLIFGVCLVGGVCLSGSRNSRHVGKLRHFWGSWNRGYGTQQDGTQPACLAGMPEAVGTYTAKDGWLDTARSTRIWGKASMRYELSKEGDMSDVALQQRAYQSFEEQLPLFPYGRRQAASIPHKPRRVKGIA